MTRYPEQDAAPPAFGTNRPARLTVSERQVGLVRLTELVHGFGVQGLGSGLSSREWLFTQATTYPVYARVPAPPPNKNLNRKPENSRGTGTLHRSKAWWRRSSRVRRIVYIRDQSYDYETNREYTRPIKTQSYICETNQDSNPKTAVGRGPDEAAKPGGRSPRAAHAPHFSDFVLE